MGGEKKKVPIFGKFASHSLLLKKNKTERKIIYSAKSLSPSFKHVN